MGAWIETTKYPTNFVDYQVAPRVGAWIETDVDATVGATRSGRTPCGCVD